MGLPVQFLAETLIFFYIRCHLSNLLTHKRHNRRCSNHKEMKCCVVTERKDIKVPMYTERHSKNSAVATVEDWRCWQQRLLNA